MELFTVHIIATDTTSFNSFIRNPTFAFVDTSGGFYGREGGICFSAEKPRRLQCAAGTLPRAAFRFPNNHKSPGGFCRPEIFGAGYGNRTRLLGLGSRCTTDVLTLHDLHSITPPEGKFKGCFVDFLTAA